VKHLQENPHRDVEPQSQERFVQAILELADEVRQTRRERPETNEFVDSRETIERLRELRSRSTAYGLAFGHRE
jgi:hypothetical protein